MAAIGTTLPTMLDLAKRMDPNGMHASVIELLAQQNEILDDIPWVEGNLPTGHRTTLRTSLPTVGYRRFNKGVASGKSTTDQIEESCAMMEARAKVDVELVKLYGGQGPAFRASEDTAFVESMSQQFATDLFTGNVTVNPDRFNGFATRVNDVNYGESSSGAKDGAVIEGGGSGSDNASIWLIGWGNDTCHGIYPKGMEAGLQSRDLGEQVVKDDDGNEFQAYMSLFQWKVGLVVRDWRYVLRIANLDVSNLLANSSAADLLKLMNRALERIPNASKGSLAFYCNRTVATVLAEQALGKASSTLTYEDTLTRRRVVKAFGVPVRKVDVLGIAEAQLT